MHPRGYKETKKHSFGERLTPQQAIRAKCYDCMNSYADGKADCETKTCSLYLWMRYNKNKGIVARFYSDEQRKAARQCLNQNLGRVA